LTLPTGITPEIPFPDPAKVMGYAAVPVSAVLPRSACVIAKVKLDPPAEAINHVPFKKEFVRPLIITVLLATKVFVAVMVATLEVT
jgi:hypothetical protein